MNTATSNYFLAMLAHRSPRIDLVNVPLIRLYFVQQIARYSFPKSVWVVMSFMGTELLIHNVVDDIS